MPTYGYRCSKCSTEFDVWQRMSDEPGAACPKCGQAAQRLFFPAGIVFKGTGFYVTDSRSKTSAHDSDGKSSSSGSDGKPSSTGSSSSDSKTSSSNASTSGKTS